MITPAIFRVPIPISKTRRGPGPLGALLLVFAVGTTAAMAQSFSPGSGAATPAIQQSICCRRRASETP
jgi:hypothetical protein